jgi:hypothetical protein
MLLLDVVIAGPEALVLIVCLSLSSMPPTSFQQLITAEAL